MNVYACLLTIHLCLSRGIRYCIRGGLSLKRYMTFHVDDDMVKICRRELLQCKIFLVYQIIPEIFIDQFGFSLG